MICQDHHFTTGWVSVMEKPITVTATMIMNKMIMNDTMIKLVQLFCHCAYIPCDSFITGDISRVGKQLILIILSQSLPLTFMNVN